jgi:hypothetical protein
MILSQLEPPKQSIVSIPMYSIPQTDILKLKFVTIVAFSVE